MCGIVAILGRHEVAPLILEALKRLEYRGYDSAGIATVHDGRLGRRRAVGKLIALSDLLVRDPIRGRAGIGHTRWATHGQPSERNAHPHQAGRVAVVHNGIIENFRALRTELEAEGAVFETETDTEAVVQLCNRELAAGRPPVEAARATLARLQGAFALCFLFDGEDDLLVAARRGSPLAVGYGDGEVFVGSDALALAPLTSRIAYLEEGDHAVLTRGSVEIFDASGCPASRETHHVPVENFYAEKGPYKHFMAKEMHEQPTVIADALARYLAPDRRSAALPAGVDFAGVDRLVLVACGTAHYACHVARYWFESLARAAGRDRGGVGVPVSGTAAKCWYYRDFCQPVGGDGRHARRAALRAWARGADRFGGQRRDLDHRAGERRGAADPGGAGDRRRLDQGVHLPAHGAGHAGARRGAAARHASPPPRRSASPPRSAARRGWWRARWRWSRRSPRSPATSRGRRTCCSSGAGRCIRWRWRAR